MEQNKKTFRCTKIVAEVRKAKKFLSDKEFSKLLDYESDENFFKLQAYSLILFYHLH